METQTISDPLGWFSFSDISSDISIRLLLAAKLFTTRGYYARHQAERPPNIGKIGAFEEFYKVIIQSTYIHKKVKSTTTTILTKSQIPVSSFYAFFVLLSWFIICTSFHYYSEK